MNVDDAASWSTATPFTTYNGTGYNATQFASFVTLREYGWLDGISLDVEHGATANTNYRNLIAAFGAYFGPSHQVQTTKCIRQLYIPAEHRGQTSGKYP